MDFISQFITAFSEFRSDPLNQFELYDFTGGLLQNISFVIIGFVIVKGVSKLVRFLT